MRKKIAILLSFVLTMAISMGMISPAQADTVSITWMNPVFQGTDSFYGASVVAYEADSTGNELIVTVDQDPNPLTGITNVSAVILNFDWGKNWTASGISTTSPKRLNSTFPTFSFTITFDVPTTATATNLALHQYRIIVEQVNATGFKSTLDNDLYTNFAVYSADQKAAMSSADNYNSTVAAYTGYSWTSAEAISLQAQAALEDSKGDDYYDRGDFANAKTSYATAVSKFEAAIAAQDEWGPTYQQVLLNNTKAALISAEANLKIAEAAQTEADAAVIEANAAMVTANATKVQADAALTNAYGWYFIGIGFAIGWTLMGIGVVIYTLRKPKPPTPSA